MNRRSLATMVIAVVGVLLLASSCAGNFAPVINSLEAKPNYWTAPLSSLQVICNASDREGDDLSYQWSASGGSIAGAGAVVNWTAPQAVGMYDVSVVVNDSQGRNATGLITVVASNGPPPVIETLNVTAAHKYLKESRLGYKVAKAYNYSIECIASGTPELAYEWSCTGGSISGNGSLITWTAPDMVCTVTVTAKVFDGVGNWIRKNVILEVVTCSECEF